MVLFRRRGKVAASDSLLPDLLDEGGVGRAERGVGDGGGAARRSGSEERLALPDWKPEAGLSVVRCPAGERKGPA